VTEDDRQDRISLQGVVVETLPAGSFRVQVEGGLEIVATLSGKMRQHRIRVVQGDRVEMEVSPYDLTRGRVTHRL
jgi:translation initiation factor IF-1